MKKTLIMTIIGIFAMGCSSAQQPENKKENPGSENFVTKPEVRWEVNKETDENGNVVRYDSTYTWSWSDNDGASTKLDVDSVMRSFRQHFDRHLPDYWGHGMWDPLHRDSTFYEDFFNDDFFHNQWQQNQIEMEKMFRQMDSLRNSFFDEHYPGIMRPQNPSSGSSSEGDEI